MALKKQIEFDNGVVADYWRVESFEIANGSNEGIINVELWKDQVTRETEGKSCISVHNFIVPLDQSMGIVLSNCYDKLKTLEAFQEAVDV